MKNTINMILSILFGILFLTMGLNKFFGFIPVPEDGIPEGLAKLNAAFKESGWLLYLIGFVEVLSGFLFFSEKFRALASIMIFPITVSILLTHIFNAPEGLPLAVGVMAINLWFILDNRKRYLPMIK